MTPFNFQTTSTRGVRRLALPKRWLQSVLTLRGIVKHRERLITAGGFIVLQFGKLEKGRKKKKRGGWQNYTFLKFVLMNERGSVERSCWNAHCVPLCKCAATWFRAHGRAVISWCNMRNLNLSHWKTQTVLWGSLPAACTPYTQVFGWRHYSYIAFFFVCFFLSAVWHSDRCSERKCESRRRKGALAVLSQSAASP